MLMITGAGRSGTSLLAKYCLLMGNDPGGHWTDDADAGFEDENAVSITRLAQHASMEMALGYAGEHPVDRAVVKVPHLVTIGKPHLLDTWLALKPELRLLVAKRPFEAVGKSFAKQPDRFKMGTDAEAIAATVRVQYDEFMAYVADKGVPHVIVPMLTDDMTFAAIHEGLTTFGGLSLTFDADAAKKVGLPDNDGTPEGVWNVLYDLTKRHH